MSKRSLLIIVLTLIIVIAVISGVLTYFSSSMWGSSHGPFASNAGENKLQCPDLSETLLYGQDKQLNVWVAGKADYETKTRKLVYSPVVHYGGSFIEKFSLDQQKVYMCDLGSHHIELGEDANKYNPSHVYCGDFIRPVALYGLDSKGNVIKSSRTSVEIIFDGKTNKYISTRCGAYDAINAPF